MFYLSNCKHELMKSTSEFDSERGRTSKNAKDTHVFEKPHFERDERWAAWPAYIQNFSILFIIVIIPTFIFNALFSDMTPAGRGTQTFSFLSSQDNIAFACGTVGSITLVLTYLFDGFKYWRDDGLICRQYIVFGVVGICFVFGGFFAAREYPFCPHAVSLMIFLCYAYMMWITLLKSWDQGKFLYYMWRVLAFIGMGVFTFFVVWVFAYDHLWDDKNKDRIADEISSDDGFKCEYDEETDSVCLHAFLVWFSPFFLAGIFIVFAVVVYFLEAYVTDNTSGTKDLAFRGFITLIVLSAMSVWAAASVAGAGMGLATAVVAFMFSATVWVGVLACASLGFDNLQKRFFNVPLVKKIYASVLNEWFKALFIMLFFWVIIFYFIASFFNQKLREWNCTRKKGSYSAKRLRHRLKTERNSQFDAQIEYSSDEDDSSSYVDLDKFDPETGDPINPDDYAPQEESESEEENGPKADSHKKSCCRLTKQASRHYYMMFYWNWTSITMKIVIWGVIYLTLMVATAKFVTIFLAWLSSVISEWNLGIVIAIFMGIGLTMFLLPPVPGVPVYLTGGIIIPTAAEANGINFWVGVAIASGVCCVVKFLAIICQQKIIGERMGKSVWVREFVGVNSISIRAIEKILKQKGLKLDKMCILTGGPDWPTSVLTGILGLNVWEMLLGSCPILLLIAPTCTAGAMFKKGAEGGIWAALSSVTLMIAALLQGIGLLAAAHFIEKTAFHHEKELLEKPDDQVVKSLDEIKTKFRILFYREVQWKSLGIGHKILLTTASVLMILCCFIVQLFDSSCFETVQLTDRIQDPPLNGNPLNLFKPLGWVTTALFFLSVSLYWSFLSWAVKQMKKQNDYERLKQKKEDILKKEKSKNSSGGITVPSVFFGDRFDF